MASHLASAAWNGYAWRLASYGQTCDSHMAVSMPHALRSSLSPSLLPSLLLCPEPGPILVGDMGRRTWRHRLLPLVSCSWRNTWVEILFSECHSFTHRLAFTVSVLFSHNETGSHLGKPGRRHTYTPIAQRVCVSPLRPRGCFCLQVGP